MGTVESALPKYKQVYDALWRDIHSGRLKRGDRLPSEAELVRTVRRIAHHRRPCGARPAARRLRRAPRRVGDVRQGAARAARAVVRPADSRSRRDGDLRARLSGDDGVAARAQARAGLGQRQRSVGVARGAGLADLSASTSIAASPACSSRRSSTRPEKRASTSASPTRSMPPAFPWCCSIVRSRRIRPAAATISSASTTAAPAT